MINKLPKEVISTIFVYLDIENLIKLNQFIFHYHIRNALNSVVQLRIPIFFWQRINVEKYLEIRYNKQYPYIHDKRTSKALRVILEPMYLSYPYVYPFGNWNEKGNDREFGANVLKEAKYKIVLDPYVHQVHEDPQNKKRMIRCIEWLEHLEIWFIENYCMKKEGIKKEDIHYVGDDSHSFFVKENNHQIKQLRLYEKVYNRYKKRETSIIDVNTFYTNHNAEKENELLHDRWYKNVIPLYDINGKEIPQNEAQLNHGDLVVICLSFKHSIGAHGLNFKIQWIQKIYNGIINKKRKYENDLLIDGPIRNI